MPFVTSAIPQDADSLVASALDQLNTQLELAGLPGWTAADADTLVIFLNTIADIAANISLTASQMLSAAFRAYGTQLQGIPYQTGTPATVSSTFSFTGPAPDSTQYAIPDGLVVLIDGQIFYTSATPVDSGDVSAVVILTASESGASFNGLGGQNVAAPRIQLSNPLTFVSSVQTNALTANGTDAETDDQYQDRLVAELALQSPRAVTPGDFASLLVSDIAAENTGVVVGRATDADLYWAGNGNLNGNVTLTSLNGSASTGVLQFNGSFASASAGVSSTSGPWSGIEPAVGSLLTGTGIQSATYVTKSASASLQMSKVASATGTHSFTATASQNVPNCVTVVTTDNQGQNFTQGQLDTLSSYLSQKRLICTQVFVQNPTRYDVYVTCHINVLPAYVGNESVVVTAVQNSLLNFYNPLTWGTDPLSGAWNNNYNSLANTATLRLSDLYPVILSTQGVAYVTGGSLTFGAVTSGGAAPAQGTSDFVMAGPAPLPFTQTNFLTIVADD